MTDGTEDVLYALNDGPFQNSNLFENLFEGEYLAKIKYRNHCEDSMLFIVNGTSPPPIIENIGLEFTPCSNNQNTLSVLVEKGTPPYSYQLDDEPFQASPIFLYLKPGEHSILVQDINLCQEQLNFNVEKIDSFTYTIDRLDQPECGESNGLIQLNITGGKGVRQIKYQDQYYPDQFTFEGLLDGLHTFILSDEANCTHEIDIPLLADCKIYIPNIFSPNGDDVNDYLSINLARNATAFIRHFNIYDRWGNSVFTLKDQTIEASESIIWDGSFNDKICIEGVYVYEYELLMYNDVVFKRDGNITLHR